MDKLPRRKDIRLKGYDYSQAGYYFITACTKDRKKVFAEIVGDGFHTAPGVDLTPMGKEVQKSIEFIGKHYSNALFDKFIIMPNHIHLIIILQTTESGGHGNPNLHKIIGQLKSYTNKRYNEINNKRDLILWQRNYYDRIIRNEHEYQEIWQYIETNPLKWQEDKYYI